MDYKSPILPFHQEISLSPARLALWKLEEEAGFFLPFLDLSPRQEELIRHFQPLRLRQWLAVRYLAGTLSGIPSPWRLDTDEFGKPFLEGCPREVSFSHSGAWILAAVSPGPLGADVEIYRDKILGLASKFCHPSEEWPGESASRFQWLHLVWSAKESLYKLHGKKGLAFREDLRLERPEHLAPEGMLAGGIRLDGRWQEAQVVYGIREEFTWTLATHSGPGLIV